MTDLTPTAARIFDSVPPYYLGEPTLTRLVQSVANEWDRIEAFLTNVQAGLVPTLADDSVGLLAIWEYILGLPVMPAGIPLAQRQAAVAATFMARFCRTTAEWVAAMDAGLGGAAWTHQVCVPGPGQMTITIPFTEGGYVDGIIRTLARRLTPANYELIFAYTDGFIVGVSEVGDAI